MLITLLDRFVSFLCSFGTHLQCYQFPFNELNIILFHFVIKFLDSQILDLSDKLEQSANLGRIGHWMQDPHDKRCEDKLMKVTRDSNKTTIEIIHGLMAQTIKDRLFNHVTPGPSGSSSSSM